MSQDTAGDISPRTLGIVSRALAGLFKSDPKAARELVADAGIASEIRKATDEAGKMLEATTDGKLDMIDDQWDGAPGDKLKVGGGHGPGSTAASGEVNTGPSQTASGDGAEKMTREYSRPAPQGGVQRSTEQLGRDLGLSSMRKAMVLIHKALEGHNAQVDMLRTAIGSFADLETMVQAAVSKALTELKPVVVAKAEEKEDEKKEEKKEETAKGENPFKKEEDEDKEEAKSSVASDAVKAKSFLSKAKDAVRKAVDADLDGNAGFAKSWSELAKSRLALATKFDASEDMAKAVMSVAKAIKGGEQNQDTWPATEEKKIGKSEAPSGVDPAQFAKGMEAIEKANQGLAMLQGTVGDLFKVMGGQSRNPENSLPPVFELVKSEVGVAGKEAEIAKLVETNVISHDDADNARDVLMRFQAAARGDVNKAVPVALAKRLVPAARALFIPAEQAA